MGFRASGCMFGDGCLGVDYLRIFLKLSGIVVHAVGRVVQLCKRRFLPIYEGGGSR